MLIKLQPTLFLPLRLNIIFEYAPGDNFHLQTTISRELMSRFTFATSVHTFVHTYFLAEDYGKLYLNLFNSILIVGQHCCLFQMSYQANCHYLVGCFSGYSMASKRLVLI